MTAALKPHLSIVPPLACQSSPRPDFDQDEVRAAISSTRDVVQLLRIPPGRSPHIERGVYGLLGAYGAGKVSLDAAEVDLDVADPLLAGAGLSIPELLLANPHFRTEHDPAAAITLAVTRYWAARVRAAIQLCA